MDDEWGFPAPLEDPEGRKAKPGQSGGGCPIAPNGNFVEGAAADEADAGEPREDGPRAA